LAVFRLCAVLLPGAQTAAQNVTNDASWVMGSALTLAEAQTLALHRNWDLLAAAAGIEAATAQRIVAREFPNPTLSASTTKISVDPNFPSSTPEGNGFWERSYDSTVAINQLLEIGGKRRSRQASAAAGFESARALFYDAKRALDLGVSKAYVAATLAEENRRVLVASAESLRQEAKLAEVRLQAGEISAADKKQIEITAERFELDARAASTAAAQARVALELLLGAPAPTGKVLLAERLESLSALMPPPATNSARLRRPDVVAAEAALTKTEADWHLQRANRIPDPTFLVQYEHEPPDQPNTLGFGVSFPIPLWNRNRGNILAAQAAREQARLALAKVEAQAAADITTSRLAYDEAVVRWRKYSETLRPKSEDIRKTMAYAYEQGGASLLDLLVAERNDNEVRLAAAQAAADTAIAVAALTAATTEMAETGKR